MNNNNLIIGYISSYIFLDICVFMVVDSHTMMTGTCGEVFDDTGFSCTGWALQSKGTRASSEGGLSGRQGGGGCGEGDEEGGDLGIYRKTRASSEGYIFANKRQGGEGCKARE